MFLGVTSQIWILFYLKNNRVMLKSYGSKKLQNNIVFRLDINNIQWSTIPWMIAWNISERYITAKSYVCKRDYIRDGEKTANRDAILSNEFDKSIFVRLVRLTKNSLFINRPRGAMILLMHFRDRRRSLINCSLIPTRDLSFNGHHYYCYRWSI